MTMRKRLVAAACLFALTLGVVAAYAQRPRATVQIPFDFTAANSELPAGTYTITTDNANPGLLVLRNEKGGKSGLCPVITRLAPSESSKPQVVFDKVGEKRILSEVYLPGADGFQLAGTTSEHTHQKVSGADSK
jgi:hypothetical protein